MSFSAPEIDLLELYNQCKFGLQARSAASAALDRFGPTPTDTLGPGRRYQREVFRNLHSLVTHAGNVSKLLWPPETVDNQVHERARALRTAIDLRDDEERVLKSASLRSSAGPYEQLRTDWTRAHDAEDVLLDHIASSTERLADLNVDARMRAYDPSREEFVLWEEHLQVGEVAEVLRRICEQVEERIEDVDRVRYRHSE